MEENRLNAEYVGEVISETVVTTTTTIYMLIGWERRWYNESNKYTAYSLVYILMDFT